LLRPKTRRIIPAMPTARIVPGADKRNVARATFNVRGDEASAMLKELPTLKRHLAERWKITKVKVTFTNPCYPDHTQFSLAVELANDIGSAVVGLVLTEMYAWGKDSLKNFRKKRSKKRKSRKTKVRKLASSNRPRKKR
jgi:hypothetical protein